MAPLKRKRDEAASESSSGPSSDQSTDTNMSTSTNDDSDEETSQEQEDEPEPAGMPAAPQPPVLPLEWPGVPGPTILLHQVPKYNLTCPVTGFESVFVDLSQLFRQDVEYVGLRWCIFGRDDGFILTPAATGAMFSWFYKEFVYYHPEVRGLPLPQLAVAADLMDARCLPIIPSLGNLNHLAFRAVIWPKVKHYVTNAVRERRVTRAWQNFQLLHSARVMSYMTHGIAKYRTRHAAMSAQLTEEEIETLLGNPGHYRRRVRLRPREAVRWGPMHWLMPPDHSRHWATMLENETQAASEQATN